MALSVPPSITPAPSPAPERGDRATFSARVESLLTWLTNAGSQFSDLAVSAYDNAVVANTAAATAESVANVAKWVSGTSYTEGVVVWSPTDFRAYRLKANLTSTTDPAVTLTYWAPLYVDTAVSKDTSDGYAGLTLYKLNMKNVAGTITSFFTNTNTVARTYTLPDKSGTVAMIDDITTGTLSTSPTIGIGYATGAGATVTQLASKSSGVTINTVTGRIITHNATLSASPTAGCRAFFTVTNSAMTSANDIVLINGFSSGGGIHKVWVDTRAVGSFRIGIENYDTTATHSLAVTIDFTIIRAVAS